jgi:hypothetical protein
MNAYLRWKLRLITSTYIAHHSQNEGRQQDDNALPVDDEKGRVLRSQTAAELRGDLKRLKRDSESGRMSTVAGKQPVSQTGSISKKRPSAVGAVVFGIFVGGFLLGRMTLKPAPLTPPVFHQLTFRHGDIRMARFSSDGKTILYSASSEEKPIEIYTTRPESPESRPFGLDGAEVLSVSS